MKFLDDPDAMHFQIRNVDKDGGGSFYYFSVLPGEDIGKKAGEVATEEYLKKGYENASFRSFGYFKPRRSMKVVQYDRQKKDVMKGGIKFSVRLSFVQATYNSGRKDRTEWYEADGI